MLAFIDAHFQTSSTYEFLIEILKHIKLPKEDPDVTRHTLDAVAKQVQSFDDRLRAYVHTPFFPAIVNFERRKTFKRILAPQVTPLIETLQKVEDQLRDVDVGANTPLPAGFTGFTGTPRQWPEAPAILDSTRTATRLVKDLIETETTALVELPPARPTDNPETRDELQTKINGIFAGSTPVPAKNLEAMQAITERLDDVAYPVFYDAAQPSDKGEFLQLVRDLTGEFPVEERRWIQLYDTCERGTGVRSTRPYHEIRAQTILPCITAIEDWLLNPTDESGDLEHTVQCTLEPFKLPVAYSLP